MRPRAAAAARAPLLVLLALRGGAAVTLGADACSVVQSLDLPGVASGLVRSEQGVWAGVVDRRAPLAAAFTLTDARPDE